MALISNDTGRECRFPGPVCELQSILMDHLSLGVIILDSRRRIVSANHAARGISKALPFFSMNQSTLQASTAEGERSLATAIDTALSSERHERVVYFRLQQEGQDEFLHGYSVALHGENSTAPAGVALFIHDPRRTTPCVRHLRRMFPLTVAEARVASLIVEGYPLSEIAEILNISIHTVRTQLKNVFAKTGVSRQHELVRIAVGGLGFIAETPPDSPHD